MCVCVCVWKRVRACCVFASFGIAHCKSVAHQRSSSAGTLIAVAAPEDRHHILGNLVHAAAVISRPHTSGRPEARITGCMRMTTHPAPNRTEGQHVRRTTWAIRNMAFRCVTHDASGGKAAALSESTQSHVKHAQMPFTCSVAAVRLHVCCWRSTTTRGCSGLLALEVDVNALQQMVGDLIEVLQTCAMFVCVASRVCRLQSHGSDPHSYGSGWEPHGGRDVQARRTSTGRMSKATMLRLSWKLRRSPITRTYAPSFHLARWTAASSDPAKGAGVGDGQHPSPLRRQHPYTARHAPSRGGRNTSIHTLSALTASHRVQHPTTHARYIATPARLNLLGKVVAVVGVDPHLHLDPGRRRTRGCA